MDCQMLLGFLQFMLLTDVVELGRRNVAINKTVTSSSLYQVNDDWNDLGTILDGNLEREGKTCECCAATSYSNNPWITVDLEKEHWIDIVTLYGRTDDETKSQSFLGLELFFTQHSEINKNSTAAYKVDGSGYINFLNITFEEQVYVRYLTFYMPIDSRILSMCEVEVYGTDCMYGFYGPSCNHNCGQCYNGDPCDDATGYCKTCKAGYKGSDCVSECTPGTYGEDCQFSCRYCYDDKPCDFRTGACDKCKSGYNGMTCSLECDDGNYGSNCPGVCGHCYNGQPCDKIDGTCEVCSSGYQGRLCVTECKPGTYGQSCSEECGICRNYTSCDHVTGICVNGCAPGRRGSHCKHDCEMNTFGENCTNTCHCQEGIACNPFTGSCENGICADGYAGFWCQQTTFENKQAADGVSLPIFIGVTSFLICVIIVVVVFFLFLNKRKTQAKTEQMAAYKTDSHPYDDLQLAPEVNSAYNNID